MRVLVAAVLVIVGGIAHAEPKASTLAVLDLGGIAETASIAADLTTQLRAQPTSKRFRVAAPVKAVAAAVVKADCAETERTCAASIGAILGVDYVLIGELALRGSRRTLTLELVDVKTKQRVRSLADAATSDVDLKKWAKTVYARVVDVDVAQLGIVANAKTGEVLIDGELVAALSGGRAILGNLAVGAHRLSIRAKGYRPFDIEITVDGTTQTFLLEPLEIPPEP